mgnify:CR=1 FL=1
MYQFRKIVFPALPVIILLAILPNIVHAQKEAVWMDLLRYQNGDDAYVEVQMEFASKSLHAQQQDGGWQTIAIFEATLETSAGIVNYAKTEITGPLELDSAKAVAGTQLHLERIQAPSGNYRLNIQS